MTTAQEQADLLAEIGGQNKATMGALLGTGSIAKATERADGTMEATIRIPEDAMAWEPAVLVLPHAGTVELTINNDDKNTHPGLL
ncbi:MSMEG_3727 family PQQ-associated protein, partial [Streptomyces sp. NPDC057062]|uniref:MSMEG_3727 family PQQ-associated protein n=1 Tax=Streptomyces sp. NPDC057062 TaxID=3346011 RepID=UPI003644FA2F